MTQRQVDLPVWTHDLFPVMIMAHKGNLDKKQCNFNSWVTIRTWVSESANIKNVVSDSEHLGGWRWRCSCHRRKYQEEGVDDSESESDGLGIRLNLVKTSPIGQAKRQYGGWTQNE